MPQSPHGWIGDTAPIEARQETPLIAVPNVSEGRDAATLDAIGAAFTDAGARLLNRHEDPDHHRAVYTLAAAPGALAPALVAGAREAVARIDVNTPRGAHPHVGAIDVVPVVHVTDALRGAACAEALVVASDLADELDLPVFLYGELAGGRSRAELRSGGIERLAQRMASGELAADFGPQAPHPSAGATLVAARPPLVAFNVELAPPASFADARRIAEEIREGGAAGLAGVRAIAVELTSRGGTPQVSTNIEDPAAVPLAEVVEAVRRHVAVLAAEIVGLVPRAALEGFPEDVALPGFEASRQVIEDLI